MAKTSSLFGTLLDAVTAPTISQTAFFDTPKEDFTLFVIINVGTSVNCLMEGTIDGTNYFFITSNAAHDNSIIITHTGTPCVGIRANLSEIGANASNTGQPVVATVQFAVV